MSIALLVSSIVILVVSVATGMLAMAGVRQVRDLARLLDDDSAENAPPVPSLSIIVTARDEEESIEAVVRGFLAQRFPDLELIVVDDRSTDATGAILDRLAAEPDLSGDRLRIVHVGDLPHGWLGKCHACHVGAQRARGQWLLFTDADVSLTRDDLLERIVRHAVIRQLDHLAVFPDLRPMGALQAGIVSCFGQVFVLGCRAFEMDRDLPRGGGGVGAFNLVRRSMYDRVGGHTVLRMDVVDDFKLGRLLKEAGARQRIVNGSGLVRCPWHRGALNVILGMEKNFFAGFDYSLIAVTLYSMAAVLLTLGPLLLGGIAGFGMSPRPHPALLALAWLPLIWQIGFVYYAYRLEAHRVGRRPVVLALLYPISFTLLLVAVWNSTLRTLTRGGVQWRGTFYPLAALRRGNVRPGSGRRFLILRGDLPPAR